MIALVTYRRNVRTKRAEWLSTLHAKFFESTNYKSMRHIIDYEPPEFVTLRDCIAQGGSDQLVESFVDYLNFFEFIASQSAIELQLPFTKAREPPLLHPP